MSIKWKYKIELRSDKVLKGIEKEIGTRIPNDLLALITEHNAASPEKSHIMIDSIERVFEAMLSFNEKESDAYTYFSARKAIAEKDVVPFAIDPFGNYFCYSLKKKTIAFYLHEENSYVDSKLSLTALIDGLY